MSTALAAKSAASKVTNTPHPARPRALHNTHTHTPAHIHTSYHTPLLVWAGGKYRTTTTKTARPEE